MSGNNPGQPAIVSGIIAGLNSTLAAVLWSGRAEEKGRRKSSLEDVGQIRGITHELECPQSKRQRTVERITPAKRNSGDLRPHSQAQTPHGPGDYDIIPAAPEFSLYHVSDDYATGTSNPVRHCGRPAMPSQLLNDSFRPVNTLHRGPYSTTLSSATKSPSPLKCYGRKRASNKLELESVTGANVEDRLFDLEGPRAEDRKAKKAKTTMSTTNSWQPQVGSEDVEVLGERLRDPPSNTRKLGGTPLSSHLGYERATQKPCLFGEIEEYRSVEKLHRPKKSRSQLHRVKSNSQRYSQVEGHGEQEGSKASQSSSTPDMVEQQATIELSTGNNPQNESRSGYLDTDFLKPPREKDRRREFETKIVKKPYQPATASKYFSADKFRDRVGSPPENPPESEINRSQPKRTKNMRDQFHGVDDSPDELQDDTNAGVQSHKEQLPQVSCTEEALSPRTDIPSSNFISSRKQNDARMTGKIKLKLQKDGENHLRLRLQQFQIGHLKSEESVEYYLLLEPHSSSYKVYKQGQDWPEEPPIFRIEAKTLQRVTHGQDNSGKIQLMGSRGSDEIDHKFDLEFYSHKDLVDLIKSLQARVPTLKVLNKSSDEMDKIFKKRDSERLADQARRAQHKNDSVSRGSLSKGELQQLTARKAQRQPQTNGQRSIKISDFGRTISPDHLKPKCAIKTSPQAELSTSLGFVSDRPTRTRSSTTKHRQIYQTPSPQPQEVRAVERYSQKVGLGKEWTTPLIYPAQGPKRANVEFRDLERLDDGQFLNDNLISFYLRYLENQLQQSKPEAPKEIYFFNTYFYASLSKAPKGKRINYDQVQRWTSKVNIFEYDFVVVPINENAHWYLAIVCNLPKLRRIPHANLDSPMRGPSSFDGPTEVTETLDDSSISVKSHHANSQDSDADIEEAEEQVSQLSLAGVGHDERSEPDVIHSQTPNRSFVSSNIDLAESSSGTPSSSPSVNPNPKKEPHAAIDPARVSDYSSRNISKSDQRQPTLASGPKRQKRIYDPTRPIIMTLDSLALSHSVTARNLKEYLVLEAKSKLSLDIPIKDIPAMTAKDIPLQENYCDCGLFLLGYVAKFVKKPYEFVAAVLGRKYDINSDWPEMNASEMRTNIRGLIRDLHREQTGENKVGAPAKSPAKSITKSQATIKQKAAEETNAISTRNERLVPPRSPRDAPETKGPNSAEESLRLSDGLNANETLKEGSSVDKPGIPPANLAVPSKHTLYQASKAEKTDGEAKSEQLLDDTPIVTSERPVVKKHMKEVDHPAEPQKPSRVLLSNIGVASRKLLGTRFNTPPPKQQCTEGELRSSPFNTTNQKTLLYADNSDADSSVSASGLDTSKFAVIIESPKRPPTRGKN